MKTLWYYLPLLVAVLACNLSTPELEDEIDTELETVDLQILLVGNSLTYYNELPKRVQERAQEKGKKIGIKTLAYGNYALEDHWNDGLLQKLVESKEYQYVVVQQGPSSQADGRSSLLEYGQRIQALCQENEAQLAFYMVWPSRMYYHTFDQVIENYTVAADSSKAILCPVGAVWKAHFDATQDFSYYGPDGFHPSVEGSQEAARVIVEHLLID